MDWSLDLYWEEKMSVVTNIVISVYQLCLLLWPMEGWRDGERERGRKRRPQLHPGGVRGQGWAQMKHSVAVRFPARTDRRARVTKHILIQLSHTVSHWAFACEALLSKKKCNKKRRMRPNCTFARTARDWIELRANELNEAETQSAWQVIGCEMWWTGAWPSRFLDSWFIVMLHRWMYVLSTIISIISFKLGGCLMNECYYQFTAHNMF